eukprot:Skav206781  [mRNA]  locus=scaffold1075:230963:237092:+ [translate_table: standard]
MCVPRKRRTWIHPETKTAVHPIHLSAILRGRFHWRIRDLSELAGTWAREMTVGFVHAASGLATTVSDSCWSSAVLLAPHWGSNSVLELGYSCIADLSCLVLSRFFEQLPLQGLRILHLPGNEISKLEGLQNMEQLRELVLDKNRVKQFDEKSFEGLRALRELRLEDNGLKSLSNMGPLPRLRALYLSLNRIVELSELEKLRSLRHLLVVHMAQNPATRQSYGL